MPKGIGYPNKRSVKDRERLSGKALREHMKKLKGKKLSPLAQAVKESHG